MTVGDALVLKRYARNSWWYRVAETETAGGI